uniref:Uncharacterized protein n=1 Tax=Yersinia enterocolitica W22703 TaxID=913028 RepID=F4N786_YEREN|nr:unknown protein [Yersinia enterocolitica W22703]
MGHTGASYTCIGQIGSQSEGVKFFREGKVVEMNLRGFDHFSAGKTHG